MKKDDAWKQEREEIAESLSSDLLQFAKDLHTESERSVVVLAAERLNVALENMLKAYFIPSANKSDKLFGVDGAVATFSRRTEVAYRLGLINLRCKYAVDIVRDLRNDFAHATRVERLTSQKHADRIGALRNHFEGIEKEKVEKLIKTFHSKRKSKVTALYLACIVTLVIKIEFARVYMRGARVTAKANSAITASL